LYIYDDPGCDARDKWGQGYFIFCRVPREKLEGENDRDGIAEKLANKHYDLVVYHLPHDDFAKVNPPNVTGFLYFDVVTKYYPQDRVLFMNDADLLFPMVEDAAPRVLVPHGRYLRRETTGCFEDIVGAGMRENTRMPMIN
jgi:hypothetical protein